jgi:hypothetical protein
MFAPRRRVPVRALSAMAALIASACGQGSKATKDVVAPRSAESSVAAARDGMRAYRDPTTGGFVAPPPAVVQPPAAQARAGSSAPLVELPSPYGGVIVRLPRTFATNVVATRMPEGGLQTRCTEPSSEEGR